MPYILRFVPHPGCLDFVIEDIFFIITEEHFQFVGAFAFAAHKRTLPFIIAVSGRCAFEAGLLISGETEMGQFCVYGGQGA